MTTMTPELRDLTLIATATALMWLPYTLARIQTRGVMAALGYPDPTVPPDPAWAERARRAHANAIENLAVFATLVLIAAQLGVSTPGTVLAGQIYLGARLVHYVVYAAKIPVLRTLSFVAGWAATLMMAVPLLGLGE